MICHCPRSQVTRGYINCPMLRCPATFSPYPIPYHNALQLSISSVFWHVMNNFFSATNWGVNIHLAEWVCCLYLYFLLVLHSFIYCMFCLPFSAVCPVCTLQLAEQVSSSNQGLLVFECGKYSYSQYLNYNLLNLLIYSSFSGFVGHVFHRFCVPERACVVCFHQSLKTLGKTRMSNEENTASLIWNDMKKTTKQFILLPKIVRREYLFFRIIETKYFQIRTI